MDHETARRRRKGRKFGVWGVLTPSGRAVLVALVVLLIAGLLVWRRAVCPQSRNAGEERHQWLKIRERNASAKS